MWRREEDAEEKEEVFLYAAGPFSTPPPEAEAREAAQVRRKKKRERETRCCAGRRPAAAKTGPREAGAGAASLLGARPAAPAPESLPDQDPGGDRLRDQHRLLLQLRRLRLGLRLQGLLHALHLRLGAEVSLQV